MNREQLITSMCYTWRHDYGLRRGSEKVYGIGAGAGITENEAKSLWQQMAQIFDNDISPIMEFKNDTGQKTNQES